MGDLSKCRRRPSSHHKQSRHGLTLESVICKVVTPMSKLPMLKHPILLAAVRLARTQGLRGLKRLDIATAVGCATGTVSWHFKSMDQLRGTVIDYAIKHEIIEVLVQARAERDPRLGRLSAALKERVANHITG